MSWWSEFANRFEFDAPIGRQTWFCLGGCARYLFRPRTAEDLASVMIRARQGDLPCKVLGSGANVLVSDDGFDGVVVRLDDHAFCKVDQCGTALEVGAGVELMPLARNCSERGLSGLEGMAGIPGTVGGAVRMNAGGRFGEFGQVVRQVRLLRMDGGIETWPHDRIGFAYRRTELGDRIVLSARLELVEDDPHRVKRRFEECLEYKTRSQPLAGKSAGCIFKNPAGQSAGALIDKAGLKGTRYGEAYVSDQHANFIIARHGATASDILHLIDLIRERVRRVFDIELEVEVDIW
ncbi:MAG: UDP-N-acetylmuramate dehydrogenase [Phycisphaerae bacterium]